MDHLHDQLTGDEQMYKEDILEHYRFPHNAGTLDDFSFRHKELNQSCGDTLEMYVKLDAGKVAEVRFVGQGCAISQAAASMLTDGVRGMSVDDLKKLGQEDVFKMLGIRVGPTRIKCAMLALKTLHAGLALHEER